MNRLSSKNKIVIFVTIWLAICAIMFSYFFKILSQANEAESVTIIAKKKELSALEAERDSFILAQKDLTELASKPLQPEDFFSKDVTLVKEIETIEKLAGTLNLQLTLSGLSGIAKNAPKAKTVGDIVVLPYNISISGSFAKVVDFIQIMENMYFITNLSSVSVNAQSGDNVIANLNSSFYVKP